MSHAGRGAASLLAKLDAAQAAFDRGQPAAAAGLLRAFLAAGEAQAGTAIASERAAHLAMHAELVIAALTA